MKRLFKELTSVLLIVAIAFAFLPVIGNEVAYAEEAPTGDMGHYNINLISGSKSFDIDEVNGASLYFTLEGLLFEDQSISENNSDEGIALDLDNNGSSDVKLVFTVSDGKHIFTISKLSTSSIKTNKTLKLSQECMDSFKDQYPFFSSITVYFAKSANTLSAAGKTRVIKYSKLRKKTQYIAPNYAYSISKARGTVTYAKVSVNSKKYAKKFLVNSKTGRITVKRGVRRGTYKLRVKITAAGTAYFKAGSKIVTVIVRVK